MKKTILNKNIVYEMYSYEKGIDDIGQTMIYFIRAYYSNAKSIKNIKFYNTNYDIGDNKEKSNKLFNLITSHNVNPIHIEDIILDILY